MSENSGFYQEDLAFVHDSGYGDVAGAAALFLLDQLARRSVVGGLIVDLGCGSGILAAHVSAAGFEVCGVDYSEPLIAIARQQAPKGQFHAGSFLDFEIPACVAVTAIGEVLNYRLDQRNNRDRLQGLFRRVFQALQPGGLFLFDMVEPGLLGPAAEVKKIVDTAEWTMFLHHQENRQEGILMRQITLFRRTGDTYRKSQETHHLQLYPRGEIRRLLEETGFSTALTDRYHGLPFREHQVGFIATKP